MNPSPRSPLPWNVATFSDRVELQSPAGNVLEVHLPASPDASRIIYDLLFIADVANGYDKVRRRMVKAELEGGWHVDPSTYIDRDKFSELASVAARVVSHRNEFGPHSDFEEQVNLLESLLKNNAK